MQKVKYYRCPACKKVYNSLKPWSNHMLTAHKELIPEGWSSARYFYYLQTGKEHHRCRDPSYPGVGRGDPVRRGSGQGRDNRAAASAGL